MTAIINWEGDKAGRILVHRAASIARSTLTLPMATADTVNGTVTQQALRYGMHPTVW